MTILIYGPIIIVAGVLLFILALYIDKIPAGRIVLPILATLLAAFIGTVIFSGLGLSDVAGPVFAICTMGGFILYRLDR